MKTYWQIFSTLIKNHYKLLLSLCLVFIVGIFSLNLLPLAEQEKLFQELLQKIMAIDTSNNFLLFLRIWANNSLVILLILAFSFLYFPAYLIEWVNGLALSLVALRVAPEIGWSAIVFGLLPHGLIELSVFFLASWLSLLWWTKIYRQDKIVKELSRWQFSKIIAFYFMILLLFLGVAAALEVYITPLVLGLFS